MLSAEAMRVYSGRRLPDRGRAGSGGGLPSAVRPDACGGEDRRLGESAIHWSSLVSNHPAMEAETKLQVLSGWLRGRLPRDLEAQKLETERGRKSYRQGFKRLQETDPNNRKARRSCSNRKWTPRNEWQRNEEAAGKLYRVPPESIFLITL